MLDDSFIKLEHYVPELDDMGEIQSFIRSTTPVNIHEPPNLRTSLISSNAGRTYIQRNGDLTVASNNQLKSWTEELLEFSSNIARQAHVTLDHIKNDFKKKNLKFDSDLRNHFLYTANNRLMESFDSFLIGLPKEMRSFDCTVNKTGTLKPIVIKRFSNESNNSLSISAKRKRPNESTISTNDSYITKIIDNRSNKSGTFSKNMAQIGSQISVKKVISKVIESSTSTSTSISKVNKNITPVKQLPKVTTPIDRNKSLEHARNQTNYHLYVAENRMSSPKNVARRMTLGGQIVSLPAQQNMVKKNVASTEADKTSTVADKTPAAADKISTDQVQLKTSTPKVKEVELKETKTISIAPPKINLRRKTFCEKEIASGNFGRGLRNLNKSVETLSVTLPTSRVTRSRNKTREDPLFRCEFCDYTSEVRTNYQRHILVHTGEKPFKCKHCKKGFTQKVNLLSHLRANHHEMQGDPNYWGLK